MKTSSKEEKFADGVDVLVCKILIWKPTNPNMIDFMSPSEDKCLIIRECENIEINETYKKLINTASVKFPNGTVVQKTITAEQDEKNKDENKPVYVEVLDDGAVIEKRKNSFIAKPEHFEVGQRIRIYLGYYRDTGKIFDSETDRVMEMEQSLPQTPSFDGYIVKCSISTPIELKCENLASFLKKRNCPNNVEILNAKVNDFFDASKGYDFLKDTGIALSPDTAECDINIGKINLTSDLTVADVLTEWSKYKLYSFIRIGQDNKPYLKIGRSYFSTKTKESIVNTDKSAIPPVIQFNYHVAEDNLTCMHTDPRYLAVAAEGFKMEAGKQIKYSITLRLNPEWTGSNDTKHPKFQLMNETKLSPKSQRLGAVMKSKMKDKVDLNSYTVVPYTSNKIGITEDRLIEEAKAYFEGINLNGIEGTLTVFGDYGFESGEQVELLDTRHPEKNGWYLIDEVTTRFGVNGYRQVLKLPYCIAKPSKDE